MKRILTIALMLFCVQIIRAQGINVKSFQLLEKDLTANTTGTTEKDQNGEVAALIRVVTTQKGFVFDGGILGIVKTTQKTAEIWVYVPHGIKKISISHPQLGTLIDYYFPISIEAARTYEMVLVTSAEDSVVFGEVEADSWPSGADIFIDGNKVGQTPQIVSRLLPGQHEIRFSMHGYKDKTYNVTIKRNKTIKLSPRLDKAPPPPPLGSETFTVDHVQFTMIPVEEGTFYMGATKEQGNRFEKDEKPVHEVTLSSYYIGETEVTQELWETIMGSNPSNFKGADRPVERVSWTDCQKFIDKLNEKTGLQFRLPTEAEWEFAARGGNKSQGYRYSGSNSIDDVAWHHGNSDKQTHEVKTKMCNELGIYDMSGNVFEFVQDEYDSYSSTAKFNPRGMSSKPIKVHVKRGGSWRSYSCRVSYRSSGSWKEKDCGFRLALNK